MKCLLFWVTAASAVLLVSTCSNHPDEFGAGIFSSPTYLYGGQASKLEGDISKRGGDNFAWKGSGTVAWEVQVATAGEYAVSLCHATEPGGAGQNSKLRAVEASLITQFKRPKALFEQHGL